MNKRMLAVIPGSIVGLLTGAIYEIYAYCLMFRI
jgi:hypothetical protein